MIDNIAIHETVFVTIPGDVDKDRDVDIFDIVAMAGAYGSHDGDPAYIPNYDLDGDGDVDIFDIVRICNVYQMTYPNPSWDPNADIIENGKIDIFDVVAAAGNYLESW